MPQRATRPAPGEHSPYYSRYIDLIPDGDIVATLERQMGETAEMLRAVPEAKGEHRYAPEKWTVKEVIAHIIDAERIFAYRLLRTARGDTTPLPGFDENEYARANRANSRTLADLADELAAVRRANLPLFRSLDDEEISRVGTANNAPISVRALMWITAGHERHHMVMLRERYGV
jgi:uncharacterized damage-inducible protein DinB